MGMYEVLLINECPISMFISHDEAASGKRVRQDMAGHVIIVSQFSLSIERSRKSESYERNTAVQTRLQSQNCTSTAV